MKQGIAAEVNHFSVLYHLIGLSAPPELQCHVGPCLITQHEVMQALSICLVVFLLFHSVRCVTLCDVTLWLNSSTRYNGGV